MFDKKMIELALIVKEEGRDAEKKVLTYVLDNRTIALFDSTAKIEKELAFAIRSMFRTALKKGFLKDV